MSVPRCTRPPLRLPMLALLLATALLVPATGAAAQVNPQAQGAPDTVLQWFDETQAALVTADYPTQVTNMRLWAISWIAASRAIGPGHGPFADAALASAVHDSLAALVPARAPQLTAALAATLARLPRGSATSRGVAAGRAAAARILAERAGDGLDPASVNTPFTPPSDAPGIWRPTPPGFNPAVQAGQGRARPFLLDRADRFRPSPPPSLTSPQYARDFAETKAFGRLDSTVRTPDQTSVALLWQPAALANWTQMLRQVLAAGVPRSTGDRARLLATFHAVTADAYIAVYEAKYVYLRWRPVTAIHLAAIDGNPDTRADPTWTSLFPPPDNSEYPSGHNGYTGAAVTVLTELLGPQPPRPLTLTAATAPGFTRTYTSWTQVAEDVLNARVWAGIHFRTSDRAGLRLGLQVARFDLARAGW